MIRITRCRSGGGRTHKMQNLSNSILYVDASYVFLNVVPSSRGLYKHASRRMSMKAVEWLVTCTVAWMVGLRYNACRNHGADESNHRRRKPAAAASNDRLLSACRWYRCQVLTSGLTSVDRPRISPDGTRVAFNARGTNGHLQLWVMNSDGSHRRELTSVQEQFGPYMWAWFDNSRIVYRRAPGPSQGDARMLDVDSGVDTLFLSAAAVGRASTTSRCLPTARSRSLPLKTDHNPPL